MVAAPAVAALAAAFAGPARAASGRDSAIVRTASIQIAAAPATIFSLLDPAGGFNRWSLRGETLTPLESGLWRLESAGAPEHPFDLRVMSAAPPDLIEYAARPSSRRPVGAVIESQSRYELTARPDGRTRVALTETTTFVAGMPAREFAFHAALMRLSLRMDLLRLKHEAETGTNADSRAA